ncbi:MAG: sugar phosphate isomerase/epimerase [Thermomicrobiales bacterium]
MRYSCPEQMLGDRPLAEKMRLIRDSGFDGIDARFQTLADPEFANLLATTGLELASVFSQIRTPCLLEPLAADRSLAVADIVARATAAAAAGADNLIMVPVFGPSRLSDDFDQSETRTIERALFVAAMKEIGSALRDVLITVVVEPLNHNETHLLIDPVEAADWCQLVAEPRISTMVDTYHCDVESIDSAFSIGALHDKLALMHFCDAERKLPGEVSIDFAGIIAALEARSYAGWIGFECRQIVSADDEAALRISLEWIRGLESNQTRAASTAGGTR